MTIIEGWAVAQQINWQTCLLAELSLHNNTESKHFYAPNPLSISLLYALINLKNTLRSLPFWDRSLLQTWSCHSILFQRRTIAPDKELLLFSNYFRFLWKCLWNVFAWWTQKYYDLIYLVVLFFKHPSWKSIVKHFVELVLWILISYSNFI